MTVKAAAELLGVSPNTLRSWDRTGKIRVYLSPISKYRLFKKTENAALGRTLDIIHRFEDDLEPVIHALRRDRAAPQPNWLVYHQAFLLEQARILCRGRTYVD